MIVETDQALDGKANPLLRRLLLLMVLIKYLEDREVFPRPSWFAHYQKGARCFFDVLKGGEPDNVLRLLGTLEEKFNGDVFALPAETTLTKKSLRRFATLVEARTLNQQRFLWEQFSFAHLPVEVISHLYQRFVKGSTAVYTPPFLAALLLDYAMPYNQLSGKERVLDPACGSGVFLVGAFRRLVNVWKSKHKSKTPDVETLKSILREQIFGVELDPNAVDLTAFSLALALCDCLQPNVIWNELRFDPLRNRNVLEADFFDCVPTADAEATHPIGKFNVIVGNPPFESVFSETAARVNATRINARGRIPDKQIAYLFLDLGVQVLANDGRLCLVQPSGFLYNLQTHSFRSFMAQTGRVETILDFTSIRGLFGGAGADPKTVAVILGSETNSPIVHLTFRRTYEAKQHIGFELDHYDRHHVSRERAASLLTWKTNLLGGGRLGFLAERLQQSRTLNEFVVKCGWVFGEGYINGVGKPGFHLTGKPLLTPSELHQTEIDPQTLATVTETEFLRPRNPLLFEGPLVLIGETLDLPMVFWKSGPIAYRHQITGIHAEVGELDKLRNLFELLVQSREIFRFWVAATSSRAMASMATSILKADIDSLPILEVEVGEPFCEWERILASDVTRYMADFVRLGQNSELLTTAADAAILQEYASIFCRMLGSIYDNLRASEPVFLGSLTGQFDMSAVLFWSGADERMVRDRLPRAPHQSRL